MSKLEEAITKILADDAMGDPWTELCVEAVRLGTALARFDNARGRYVRWRREHDTKRP